MKTKTKKISDLFKDDNRDNPVVIDTTLIKDTAEDYKTFVDLIEAGISRFEVYEIANNDYIIAKFIKRIPKNQRSMIKISYNIWISNFKHFIDRSIKHCKELFEGITIEYFILHFFFIEEYATNIEAFRKLGGLREEGYINKIGIANIKSHDLYYLIENIGFKPNLISYFSNCIDRQMHLLIATYKYNILTRSYYELPPSAGYKINDKASYHPQWQITSKVVEKISQSSGIGIDALTLMINLKSSDQVLIPFQSLKKVYTLIKTSQSNISRLKLMKLLNKAASFDEDSFSELSYFGQVKFIEKDFDIGFVSKKENS